MFAKQLRYLRQSRELSQVQLAEKLGFSKQSVSNWENDNIMPSVDVLEKLADFFKVSTDYLLGRETPETGTVQTLDLTGLTPRQAEHLRLLADDLRAANK